MANKHKVLSLILRASNKEKKIQKKLVIIILKITKLFNIITYKNPQIESMDFYLCNLYKNSNNKIWQQHT